MKFFIIKIAVALLIGRALCYLHVYIQSQYPFTEDLKFALWLDKNYNEQISILWYIYELSNILYKGIIWVCFAYTARFVSRKLFGILMAFAGIHALQAAGYIYNRNSSIVSEIIMYIALIVPVAGICFKDTPEAKIVHFDLKIKWKGN